MISKNTILIYEITIMFVKLLIDLQNFLSMKVFLMDCSLKKTHFIN